MLQKVFNAIDSLSQVQISLCYKRVGLINGDTLMASCIFCSLWTFSLPFVTLYVKKLIWLCATILTLTPPWQDIFMTSYYEPCESWHPTCLKSLCLFYGKWISFLHRYNWKRWKKWSGITLFLSSLRPLRIVAVAVVVVVVVDIKIIFENFFITRYFFMCVHSFSLD